MTGDCRVVREFKYVKKLTPRHISETTKKYSGHPFYPGRIEIIVPGRKHTNVPIETREYSRKKNVKIRRFWGFK
jgi:hypothetical protein